MCTDLPARCNVNLPSYRYRYLKRYPLHLYAKKVSFFTSEMVDNIYSSIYIRRSGPFIHCDFRIVAIAVKRYLISNEVL
jgi:hypothetical protein